LKQELIKRYKQQSFARFAENQTDYNKLVELVVGDCLQIIQANKSPNKLVLTNAIKLHFGLEDAREI
jgi:hypothetical protein